MTRLPRTVAWVGLLTAITVLVAGIIIQQAIF